MGRTRTPRQRPAAARHDAGSVRGERSRRADPAARAASAVWPVLGCLAIVFAFKLLVLSQLQHHPLLEPDGGLDSVSYVRLARLVMNGDLALGPGLYYLSPLYIYFLAGALAVSDSFTWVRLLQIGLGTAAVGCIYLTALDWYGRRAASIAAVLAALTGIFTFYEILILQASLDTFLTAAALMFLARALGSAPDTTLADSVVSTRYGCLTGIFFGLQILNRPNVIVAVLGVALSLAAIRRPRIAASLVAGVVLALSPVIVRNVVVSQQFALASSQGGLNLYIGNNPSATGQYAAVPGVRANVEGQSEDTRRVAEAAEARSLSDAEVSAHFTGLATRWMIDHPHAAARLFARKLALVFNARHQWLDFSYPYYARDTGSSLWLLFVGPWLLIPVGLTGLVSGAAALRAGNSRRADYYAWASFVPWYALSVAVFFVAERYRLPIFVPLCIAAGGAGNQLMLRALPGRSLAITTAVFVLAVVCAAWPFSLNDGRFEERLRLAKVLMNRGDYGGAVVELERAHALAPAHTVAEFTLGMAMVANGRAEEGVAHAAHAVDAGVPIPGARYAVAGAMMSAGDASGAASLLRRYTPAADESADSCYQVGTLALRVGAPDVAERYLTRALALRPGWPEAQQALIAARSR
ncbi:MAG: glycosyltransferase family 39 protein [Vicinamibacterales bacterium]